MNPIDAFRTYSARRQITVVAIAMGVLVVAMVVAYVSLFRVQYRVLFSDLRPQEAAAIVAELDKKKTPYRLEDGGATILAPSKLVDAARLDVMSADLPLKGAVGFELFNKSDMGLTEFAQKINYRRALQGELARTIMAIDVVESARVHLSLTEPAIFRGDRQPSKASVTLVPRPGKMLSADMVAGVQRLVAAAVPDLDVADVVVLDGHGVVVSQDVAGAVVVAAAGTPESQSMERVYASRIRSALAAFSPNDPYEIVVSITGPTAAQPEGSTTPAVDEESPDARTFQVHATVAVPAELTLLEQDQVRHVAERAIAFDPARGDRVSVIVSGALRRGAVPGAPAVSQAPPAPEAAKTPTVIERLMSPRAFLFTLLMPTFIALLAAAAVFGRRRSTPRRLSARQTQEYSKRLQTFLEREDADVRSNA